MLMAVRGVRGATTVRANDGKAIFDATAELLRILTELNGLRANDIGYVWFTVTPDLDAAFPADAARVGLGWT
ncbi:MAG: chorismate mutase, partial [Chloroflexi bacterium]